MALQAKQLSHPSRRTVGWLASLLLGVALIFGLFYLESGFGASFFVLFDRNMDSTMFSASLFSPSLDPYIWSATLFAVLGCLLLATLASKVSGGIRVLVVALSAGLVAAVCSTLVGLLSPVSLVPISVLLLGVCLYFAGLFGFSRFGMLKRALLGCAIVAFAIEAGGLVLYNLPHALNLPFATSAIATNWHLVEVSLANSAYPLLPYSYFVFVLLGVAAFLWELAHVEGLSKKLSLARLQAKLESLKRPEFEPKSAGFPIWLALLVSFAVTVFLVQVTLLPWFNPSNRLVAVDAPVYYQWLDHMRGLSGGSALQFAFGNDRALFLASSYALSFAFPSVSLIQYAPTLLVPLFTVVSLYLVRLVCGFRESWVYLVLIAPLSIQSLGLIYSGYYANMMAVIFVFLYFALLLKFGGEKTWRMLLLPLVSLLVLFSHSWTWYIFVVSLAGFLLLEWRNTAHNAVKVQSFKRQVLAVGLTVIVGLVADYARTSLVSKSSSGMVVFETAGSGLSLPNADFILSGLHLTTNFYLGGVFSSALLLALSLVGFLFMLTFKFSSVRLLVSWFVVGCVAVLFASGEYVFNRFMFLMPTLIFSALGLTLLLRYAVSQGEPRKRALLEVFVVVLAFLLLLNFALGYASNVDII